MVSGDPGSHIHFRFNFLFQNTSLFFPHGFWFVQENATKIDAAQMELYQKQFRYIKDILTIYESNAVNQNEQVMILMEKVEIKYLIIDTWFTIAYIFGHCIQMQEFGPPPPELLKGCIDVHIITSSL